MRKISLFLASLLFTSQAFGGLPPTTGKSQSETTATTTFNFQTPNAQMTTTSGQTRMIETGNGNWLVDPGFEGTGSSLNAAWVAGSGVTATQANTIPMFGVKTGIFALSAVNGEVVRQSIPAGTGIYASGDGTFNLEASAYVYNPSGAALQLCIGTYNAVGPVFTDSSCVSIPASTGGYTKTPSVFMAYTSAATLPPAIRLKTTSSSSATVYMDNAYLGLPVSLGTAQQATFFGGMEQTGATGCDYLESTSSAVNNFIDLGAGTGCSSWVVDSGGTGSVTAVGTNSHQVTLANVPPGRLDVRMQGSFTADFALACNFRITDGTNSYQPQFVSATAGGSGAVGAPNFTFSIPVTTPLSTVTYKIQAGDNGSGSCGIRNGGAGNNLSWKFYSFPSQAQSVANVNQTPYYPVFSAQISSAGVVSSQAPSGFISSVSIANTSDYTVNFGTGFFTAAPNCWATGLDTSTAAPILKILTQATTSAVVFKAYNNIAVATAFAFSVSCQSTTPLSVPVPSVINSVVSDSPGVEKTVRILFGGASNPSNCTSTPCTIYSQSGSISSVTRSGAGAYVLNFPAGTFSGVPSCACAASNVGVDDGFCTGGSAGTTTSKQLFTKNAGVSARQDTYVEAICMGPK